MVGDCFRSGPAKNQSDKNTKQETEKRNAGLDACAKANDRRTHLKQKTDSNSRGDEMDSHFKTDQINVRGIFSPIVLLKQVRLTSSSDRCIHFPEISVRRFCILRQGILLLEAIDVIHSHLPFVFRADVTAKLTIKNILHELKR